MRASLLVSFVVTPRGDYTVQAVFVPVMSSNMNHKGFSFFFVFVLCILEVYCKCPEVARDAAFMGHPAML